MRQSRVHVKPTFRAFMYPMRSSSYGPFLILSHYRRGYHSNVSGLNVIGCLALSTKGHATQEARENKHSLRLVDAKTSLPLRRLFRRRQDDLEWGRMIWSETAPQETIRFRGWKCSFYGPIAQWAISKSFCKGDLYCRQRKFGASVPQTLCRSCDKCASASDNTNWFGSLIPTSCIAQQGLSPANRVAPPELYWCTAVHTEEHTYGARF